jgi:hypothetical protein
MSTLYILGKDVELVRGFFSQSGIFRIFSTYHRAGKLGPGGLQRSILLVKKNKKTDPHNAQASRVATTHWYTDS